MNFPSKWLDYSDKEIQNNNKIESVYKYIYGIRDIQIFDKEYRKASVFVSKPVIIDSAVAEIELLTNESRYENTDIEYYISYSQYPSQDDWIPILPNNMNRVQKELLIFDSSREATLRFKCDISKGDIVVYKNNTILHEGWILNINSNGETIILMKQVESKAIYTMSYYPILDLEYNPNIIKIASENILLEPVIDKFPNGADIWGHIRLSKYPYIDKSKVDFVNGYSPISITLNGEYIPGLNSDQYKQVNQNGAILYKDQEDSEELLPKVVNRTDYVTGSDVKLIAYNKEANTEGGMAYPFFEYKHKDRDIYFTETFNLSNLAGNKDINHCNASITAEYSTIKLPVRLKAILRNNSTKKNITPILHDYSLKFKIAR